MIELLSPIIYVLLVVALCFGVYTVMTFEKGVLNLFFAGLLSSIFFFSMYFAFIYMQDSGMYTLSDVTFHLWAHILVYLSIGSIVWGGYRLKQSVSSGDVGGLSMKDVFFYLGLVIVFVAVLFYAQKLESTLTSLSIVATIGTLGLHHFIAVILGGFAFWYMRYIRGNWGLFSTSMSFAMAFVVLIGIQHLWENLTESWGVIHVSTVVGEGVEKMIILPAIALLVIGQWKVIKFLNN